jgi:type II secretory pathway pseudopilin PulG
MNRPLRIAPLRFLRLQRGWALLETAVAISLLGLMIVAVVKLSGTATGNIESRETLQSVEHAENALLGYASAHARLPAPKNAAASASRPGYVEGWLPASELGMKTPGRIRYVVESSLIATPAVYDPDPLDLAAGNLSGRTTVNALDLCAKLMQLEQAGQALPGGMRLGLGVQQAASGESGAQVELDHIWLGDETTGTPPSGVRLATRTRGFGEFAATLGCFTRLSQLSNSVKATATAVDLLKLAQQEVALRQLNLNLAEDSLLNLKWRLVNWSVALEKFVFLVGLETVSQRTTSVSVVTGAMNLASLATVIAGISWLLEITATNIKKGEVGVEKSKAALTLAQAYAGQIRAELKAHADAAAADQLQSRGLNP